MFTLALWAAAARAGDGTVTLETAQAQVRSRIGDAEPQVWTLSPQLDPDVLEAPVPAGPPTPVCFQSELDEVCFPVVPGAQVDFVIRRGDVTCRTRVVGVLYTPPAVFDAAYQAAHRGQVEVLVPEVYELVNVAIALTPFAAENDGVVATDTPYHSRVREHFAAYADHPAVRAIDEALRRDPIVGYFGLKMNGYAYEFDGAGRIQRSTVYDRVAFEGVRENALGPYVDALQAFAEVSGFRAFYAAQAPTYREQVEFFQRELDIGDMLRWLGEEFPSVRPYDGVKVVFSPLVGWSQSLVTFESGGYRELQPHVNFPYGDGAPVVRGEVLFTELNHGFLRPTSTREASAVSAALGDLSAWATEGSLAAYPHAQAVFDEHLNWGLVSLYERQRLRKADWAESRRRTDRMMVERGFPRFPAFDDALVALYRGRRRGQTVEDLYPQIIAWFAAQASEPRVGGGG